MILHVSLARESLAETQAPSPCPLIMTESVSCSPTYVVSMLAKKGFEFLKVHFKRCDDEFLLLKYINF